MRAIHTGARHVPRSAAIIAVLVALAIAPFVVACGSSSDSPTYTDTSETWSSQTPTSTPKGP